ncbi:SMC-Scp complex subunit ScpB [Candidatus Woesearchaeota archaeon]|nr:SMC-Scp complex subunit ScpB [Candidatus Woesearchaeota archaeon]
MDQNQNNEKNKIEALLFSSARRMTIEEISNMTGINDFEAIKKALNELKMDYVSRAGSVVLVEDGKFWKLNVKDHYLPIVQKIVSRTELDKPLIETLAVIAWKYPILQSEVIKIRHNKAYDHLRQLEEMGFVMRNKFGRTRKITLTEKFFEYFDLPSEEARAAFKNVVPQDVKDKVEKTEQDINEGENILEETKKKEEAKKESKEEIKKEIEEEEKEEEKELEQIKKDEEDLEEEEKKEFYK